MERSVLSALTPDERESLLGLLTKVMGRAAEVAAQPAGPLGGQRNRPARLVGPPLAG